MGDVSVGQRERGVCVCVRVCVCAAASMPDSMCLWGVVRLSELSG